ncbi:hypothetical protein FOMPIDRAFT_1035518 [Fomitopsis schrenkii]|uniref:TrmE-type G domain-containing protein n=1 Tax=Fomitopsis schrenkii TaxID=2126942 RepID=S8EDN6_FOMSC|nr:hypothetical protein FOMPIDRAFT_1035518 [Fomitopsis schrenkii]
MLRWFFAARPALRSVSTGQRKHLLVSRTSTKHTIASRPYGTSSGRGNTHAEFQDEGHLPLSDNQRRTIYALSTPPGKGGVAVVRISGPDALQIWEAMVDRGITPGRGSHPAPWHMYRCKITHPSSGEVLDDGLAVYFKAPKSFTTEDVVELHIHCGRAVVSSVLSALSCVPTCRPAEAGEFTRRAFQGGRLDLTQVEGLKDLINAETESQRKFALIAAGGATRNHFEKLRMDVIRCLALVEALIDFGEGEAIEEGVFGQARERVGALVHDIREQLSDKRRGEILRSGLRLAIFGPPNAGKSSLLNFFAQREAAIVTSVPGTTRDILELSLDIGGLPVIVADTAGIRQTDDLVESIGVERARNLVQSTDISICVLSIPDVVGGSTGNFVLPPSVTSLITPETYVLLNKSDMAHSAPEQVSSVLTALGVQKGWVVSLTTDTGTQAFLHGFAESLQERYDVHQEQASTDRPMITHARHRVHLEHALQFLEAFLVQDAEEVVLAAEELRYAAQAIGKISWAVDVEDVLDSVFRDFCIGK